MSVPLHHPLLPALPMLGLGSAEDPDPEAMAAAVAAALESGITLINSGQNYGSEPAIGEGLRRAGVEATAGAFLLCKVDLATRSHEDPARRMRRQVESSCRNFGVERLSAVALHWPLCLDAPADEAEHRAVRKAAWQELELMVDEGVVGCLGVSNFTPPLLDEVMGCAPCARLVGTPCTRVVYPPCTRRIPALHTRAVHPPSHRLRYARHPPALNEVEFSPVCLPAGAAAPARVPCTRAFTGGRRVSVRSQVAAV